MLTYLLSPLPLFCFAFAQILMLLLVISLSFHRNIIKSRSWCSVPFYTQTGSSVLCIYESACNPGMLFIFVPKRFTSFHHLFSGILKKSVDFKLKKLKYLPRNLPNLLNKLNTSKTRSFCCCQSQIDNKPSAKVPVGIKGMLHLCWKFQSCGVTTKGWHKPFWYFLVKPNLTLIVYFGASLEVY